MGNHGEHRKVKPRDKSGEIWSRSEKTVLKKLYPIASEEEIRKALPGRSWEAISKKASKMKLKRVMRGPGFFWTVEEETTLKKLWKPENSKEEIEKALPRHSWNATKLHARLIGLEPRGWEWRREFEKGSINEVKMWTP